MISYELAKQLKDAGFPQEAENGRWYHATQKIECGYYASAIYIPTLEELIEACGDKFWSLERDLDPDEIWGAYPANEIGDGPATFGSTPIEAVAGLWLALHSK